ncbi:MAG: TrmO family methyltransferase domain-containing protein [Fibrobacterota bacterium]
MMTELTSVAHVSNEMTTTEMLRTADRTQLISKIIFKEEFAPALHRIEESRFLQILFHFDRAEGYTLVGKRFRGEEKGIFACRTPFRPGGIGLTTVELLSAKGAELTVRGLDCLNNTPVIDVKPWVEAFDMPGIDEEQEAALKENPRRDIEMHMDKKNLHAVLLGAGQIHGHFCGGVSSGVMAAAYGLQELKKLDGSDAGADGLENLLAICETNSCFADGIQYAAGCTIGNNGLIYRDYGKTAVTFCVRHGEQVTAAVRIAAKGERMGIQERFPEFGRLFEEVIIKSNRTPEKVAAFKKASTEVSFDMLDTPFEELFTIEYNPEVFIPEFAPIKGSRICSDCRESIMETKAQEQNDTWYCKECAGAPFFQLDGAGMRIIKEAE